MIGICRQIASTALAVMMLSAYPLAQAPAPVDRPESDAKPPAAEAAPPAAVPDPANAGRTREQLRDLLDRHPPSLRGVLRLDPALLTDPGYLAPYPELAAFLARHPEVARNPVFYIGGQDVPWDPNPAQAAFRMWESILQGLLILSIFATVTGVLVWLVRTLVDYRRWLRQTRVQTETHTKLLDRLTSQEDLLAYMQTAAGRRFLESAPIALDPASRPLSAPLNRVLWSVQVGVVLAALGLGVLFVSRAALPEVADGLRVIGILGLSLGAGFVLSAIVAYALSSRMGLLEQRSAPGGDAVPSPALPRGRD